MIELDIEAYLPHRYPFLYIDRVVGIDQQKITAVKNVSFNESYFRGHFPGDPIMPGVLIIEALAQASGILAFYINKKQPKDGYSMYLSGIDKVRFRQPVRPGHVLKLHAEVMVHRKSLWRFSCTAFVDQMRVASAILTNVVVSTT